MAGVARLLSTLRETNLWPIIGAGLVLFALAVGLDTAARLDDAHARRVAGARAGLERLVAVAAPAVDAALARRDAGAVERLLRDLVGGRNATLAAVADTGQRAVHASDPGLLGRPLSPHVESPAGVVARASLPSAGHTLLMVRDLGPGHAEMARAYWSAAARTVAAAVLITVIGGLLVSVRVLRSARRLAGVLSRLGDHGRPPDAPGGAERAEVLDPGGVYQEATDKLSRRLHELEHARAAFAERGEYLEVTLRSIGDAVIVADAGGRVRALNAMAEQLTGWSEQDAAGRPLSEVFSNAATNGDEGPVLDARSMDAAREGDPLACEALLTARDGAVRRVALTAGPIRMREERHGAVIAFRDITEEAELREALAASERRLSAAVEGGAIGIWEWDAVTDAFDHAGPWVAHFSDRVPGGVTTGDALVAVTHPEDVQRSREDLVRHLRGESEVYESEQRILQRDDTYRHFLIRGRVSERGPEGRALKVVGTYTDVTELRVGRQQLELALEFGRQGLYEWRPLEDALVLSDSWYAHFGYEPGSITRMREQFEALVHPEDREHAREAIVDALRGERDYEAEFRVRAADGSDRWVLARGVVDQRDEQGRAVHTVGTHLDVTELKRTQERLQLAFEATRQGFMEWWPLEDRLVPDGSWYRLTGYTPGEITTTGWMLQEDRIHPQERDRLIRLLEELAQGERESGTAEYRLRFASGEYHWLLASGKVSDRDADGRVSRVVGTVIDVTSLKHAEQQLQIAVEAARQGIWEWLPDVDGFIATQSWTRLFGYAADAFSSMTGIVEDVIHPDDVEASGRMLAELVDGTRDAAEMELRMRRADGDYLWVIARAIVTSRRADGRAARVVGTDFDVTESKLAEQSLEMSIKAARQGMLEWRPLEDRLLPARSWLQLTGYAPGDVVSLSQAMRQNIVHPEDAPEVERRLEALLMNEADETSVEMRIKVRSGEYLWVLARAHVASRDPDGQPTRIISTHIDVSELRRTTERLKLAVESGRQGLWEWIPQGDRLEPLTNWLQLTGYAADEVQSMGMCYERGIVHEDDAKLVISELEALTYGERSTGEIEFRIRRKSGEIFWALTRLVVAECAPDGQAVRIIGVNIDITERRAVEERLNVALDASRQGTWEWTMADDRFVPDRHWHQMFDSGDGPPETMSEVVERLAHPADRSYLRAIARGSRTLEDDRAEAEYRLRARDGRYIWVSTRTVVAERDEEQRPARIVGATIDISHLKEAEARIKLAVQNARLGLWEWLPQTDEMHFPDESMTRLTGLEPEECRTMGDVAALMHPDDTDSVKRAAEDILAGRIEEAEFVERLRRKDGSWQWLLTRGAVVERDEHERPVRVLGTSYDVTALKETERELESSRSFLRLVLDTVPDSIFWKDTDSRYLGANRRFAEQAGFRDPNEIVGLTDDDMAWHAIAERLRHEDRRLIEGEVTEIESERPLTTADGEEIWVSTTKVALSGEDGAPMGMLGVFHDITDYRHTLEDLKAQRDRVELVIGATGVGIWSLDFDR